MLCMYQLASTLVGSHNVYYVKYGGPQVRPYVNNNKCYVRQVWPISAPLCCVMLLIDGLSAVCATSGIGRISIAIAVGYLQKIRIFLDTPISSACHFWHKAVDIFTLHIMCKLIHACLYRRGRVGQQSGSGVTVITYWIKTLTDWLVDDICVGECWWVRYKTLVSGRGVEKKWACPTHCDTEMKWSSHHWPGKPISRPNSWHSSQPRLWFQFVTVLSVWWVYDALWYCFGIFLVWDFPKRGVLSLSLPTAFSPFLTCLPRAFHCSSVL